MTNSIRDILDWQVYLVMRESILQDVSKTKKVNITEDMLNTAKAEAEAKLNAYILGEVMELIGDDEKSKARPDKLRQSPPWQRNQLRQELRNKANKKFGVQE